MRLILKESGIPYYTARITSFEPEHYEIIQHHFSRESAENFIKMMIRKFPGKKFIILTDSQIVSLFNRIVNPRKLIIGSKDGPNRI